MSVELEEGPLTAGTVLARIPALPAVVPRVLQLLAAERPDLVAVVREIGSDAALSAQVLRMANSPLYDLGSPVDSVHRAVITLGFLQVRSLVTAAAISHFVRPALQIEAMQRYWRHALATAFFARELGRAATLAPERAYTLGLLHDIGRLALLTACPHEYNRLLSAADRDGVSLPDLEKKQFGMDHCEAGHRLMEQWQLPPEFCGVSGCHPGVPSTGSVDQGALVQFACLLADAAGYSVAARRNTAGFDEIRLLLPGNVQEGFARNSDVLRETLDREIRQHLAFTESEGKNGRLQPLPVSLSAERAKPNSQRAPDERGFPAQPDPHMAGRLNWFLLSGMVLLVLAAGAFCLWKI